MKRCRILFYCFRHGHINALYQRVSASDIAEVTACVEPDEAARAVAEARLGARFTDKDYEALLATDDVDAVAIGCTYGERGAAIIAALQAGKHVISDKPICTSMAELTEIRRLCREKHLTVACMLDLRYLPQTRAAKRVLESGRLGAVRSIAFNGQHCIDYANRPTWYFEPGKHGGTINDLAIHGIDLVRMLTGMELVKTDAARVWNAYAHKHPYFRDSAAFLARLENGASVLADISYSAPTQVFSMPTYWEFRIWCEHGLMTFHYTDSRVTLYEEGTAAPVILEGEASEADYLTEFLEGLQGGADGTESVLRSTETALRMQEEADLEWTT